VSVTVVPEVNSAEQVPGQVIPDGLLVTMPEPVPLTVTARLKLTTGIAKVAVTNLAVLIVTVQVVPVQSPLYPEKVELPAGVAVNVTDTPDVNAALQVPGQLIPAGLLVTVPVPAPESVTVSVCGEAPTRS
jgi:phage tail protein X